MVDQSDHNFLSLLLPKGILDYFILSRYTDADQKICLYLDEKNDAPEEYQKDKLISLNLIKRKITTTISLKNKAIKTQHEIGFVEPAFTYCRTQLQLF